MSTSTYSWKYPVPADAQRVANELDAIYEEHGKVTPPLIVEDARNTERETHKLIEWDETAAAGKYRLEQARFIMRNIVIVRKEQAEKPEQAKVFRVFENVVINNDRCYIPTQVAIAQEDTREYLLKKALQSLASFREKYSMLQELSEVMKAIELAEREFTKQNSA